MAIVKVCYSPLLYPLYASEESVTVVVDIFRATSAICTAFQYGIARVIPVTQVEDTYLYRADENTIIAAERGGEVVDGFEFGNSPRSYMNDFVKDKTLVITTTNGTQAIEAARESEVILIGSFLNLNVLIDSLIGLNKNVMILCAGWKNRFNLEDTLFAGAVVDELLKAGFSYEKDSDAAIASRILYLNAKDNMYEFLADSSHRNRLEKLNLDEDVKYCLSINKTSVLPFYMDGVLVDALKLGGIMNAYALSVQHLNSKK
jgi:2-phosphosulfolactate phosphatase